METLSWGVAAPSPSRSATAPVVAGTATRMAQAAVAIAVVPVAVSAVWLALASDHLERPVVTGLYRAYLAALPMLIGLYWWRRRPMSRFGPLLVAFGLTAWVISWQSSDWPLAFDLGVLAEGPFTVLTFWLFVAFPSGRLQTVPERLLIAGWTAGVLGFFLPWALGSPVIAGGGPLSGCVPACPENVLQVGSAPRLVEVLGRWETYVMLALTVATLAIYSVRLATASRPRRRALIAVAVSSLLFLPAFFTYHFSRQILELDPATLLTMSWFVVGTRILLPLGFLAALFQADLFAGVARGRLLEDLVRRPSPERWRDAIARAFDDPALRLAYWDPRGQRYREPDGAELEPPAGGDRVWVEIDDQGRPIAAMVIDGALAEDPELVRAATSATCLAVENGNLEGELRDSKARILAAGDAERRRIERDLHDSAQQRLVALRFHLALAEQTMDGPAHREMVERLGTEVEEALDELRTVAHGVYPDVLRQAGIAAALRSTAQRGAIPVRIHDRTTRRHADDVELAVYYCCLEAIQNAAKHAGAGARATIHLDDDAEHLAFAVEDDGVGFDPETVEWGAGLVNITDRVSAARGTVSVESQRGRGTRIAGRLPG